MTTKASLQSILGDVDRAMSTLNEVLRTDANHYLALTRRSQVYKKVFFSLGRKESSIELLKTWKWSLTSALTTCK